MPFHQPLLFNHHQGLGILMEMGNSGIVQRVPSLIILP